MAQDIDGLLVASFPLRRGARGYFATDQGVDAIPGIIEQVLGTIPGERVMRPTFGCNIHRHLFQPAQSDAPTAQSDILEALKPFAQWFQVIGGTQGIEVTIDEHTVGYVIRYRVGNGAPLTTDGEIKLRGGR